MSYRFLEYYYFLLRFLQNAPKKLTNPSVPFFLFLSTYFFIQIAKNVFEADVNKLS